MPNVLALVGAVSGTVLAALSSYDFARHLDRQVHAVHCGFGAHGPNVASGCKVAMMSPYSSMFRSAVWGGVPIALPAMALFAFLVFAMVEVWVARRDRDPRTTMVLTIAAGVPVIASLVMGSIAAFSLGAACAVCIGIYLSSALCFAGALWLWLRARRDAKVARVAEVVPASGGYLALMAGIAVVSLLLAVVTYILAAPDQSKFAAGCGQLETARDSQRVLIPLRGVTRARADEAGARTAIEVLDPLCPACAAFERRLRSSGYDDRLARRVLLFPLESTCNWMVDSTLHPGACTISEAVLCGGARVASRIIDWAMANQERIMDATRADKGAAKRLVSAQFPSIARCVGTPKARARLNRALRWAVKNHLPVLTPQLYIDGVKVCNEDLDIGLDYTLPRMLARRRKGAK